MITQLFEVAGSLNTTIELDQEGKRTFRCIRGHVHRGDYAVEDWLKCNCPHPAILLVPGEDAGTCVECGQEIEVLQPK